MCMKVLPFTVLLLLLIPLSARGSSATQTDWSGKSHVLGPVDNWGNEYNYFTHINTFPSNIELSRTMLTIPMESSVDKNFNGAASVFSIDIDNDGDMDILAGAANDDDVTWWENTNGHGTSWSEHTISDNFDAVRSVYATDVNGDGHIDVLGAACVGNSITWWENIDGSGTNWTRHNIDVNFRGAYSVCADDVDNDGDMDVLGAAFTDDDITWWENTDSSGTKWTKHTIDDNFDSARSIHSADINGDGDMDVLGAAYFAHDITWWENTNGSGTKWTKHTIDENFRGAYSVCANDVDNDGDMDVLGAAFSDGYITWWENTDGHGTSWTARSVDGSFTGAFSACTADLNKDKYLDIIGAAFIGNDISWWNLHGDYDARGFLVSSIIDTNILHGDSWEYFDWNSTEPTGTNVAFQVRASADPDSMGSWHSLGVPMDISTILNAGDRYFQYCAILLTTDSLITPALHDITVTWGNVSIAENIEAEVNVMALYGAVPNPAVNKATLAFSLPENSWAELAVYDLSGRTVYFTGDAFYAGINEVIVDDLASGMYLVKMTSGDFCATKSFIVIK